MRESQAERFDFTAEDLEPRSFPLTLRGEEYTLLEADAAAGAAYKSAAVRGVTVKDGTIRAGDGLGELEVILVSKCLKKLQNRNSGLIQIPVTRGFVESLPDRVIKQLYAKAREMSELEEKGESDPDPELIGLCRRDLAELHHPDRGGSEEFMKGVNAALDWLKKHKREDLSKNEQSATPNNSP